MRLTIDRVSERTVGALVALFERTVGYYGAMLGINAYDQPGVESGKDSADDYLDAQRRIVSYLRDWVGQEQFSPAVASALCLKPELVEEILHRLAATGRAGSQVPVSSRSGSES